MRIPSLFLTRKLSNALDIAFSQTKAFDNKTSVLQYLVKAMYQTNKDIILFQEDIKSVPLAKGVAVDRLLTSTKQLCQDLRIFLETAAKQGDEFRKCASNRIREVKSQRASVNELRQMATFISEKDVPIGKTDTTHFERFSLFAKLELQKALDYLQEANQNYIQVLKYFGEDVKTPAADFFGVICQFISSFELSLALVEKEEEMKLNLVRRALAKEAKMRVRSITRVLRLAEFGDGPTNCEHTLSSENDSGLERGAHNVGAQVELNGQNTRNFSADEGRPSIGYKKVKEIHGKSSIGDLCSLQNENVAPNRCSIVAKVAAAAVMRQNARLTKPS